jgi:hypothetical protein
VLVVTQGQAVHLVVHNVIPNQHISVSMPQVDNFPDDTTGAAAGTAAVYDFTAARAGTFIYEAGGSADGARQAAMGLIGALVVVPDNGAGTAYGTGASAFDDQTVIVVSDVDPGLNNAPTTFDMRNFAPHFRLYNGTAFPSTTAIPVTAGGKTLLRLVNGGIIQHAVGVQGAAVTVFAESAHPVPIPYGVAAENIAAGDTLDMLVRIPAAEGLKYAVYDPTMRLDNDGAASSTATGNIVAFGGGLTFLQSSGAGTPTNTSPVVSGLTITPTVIGTSPTPVTFNATITDDVAVTGAEYLIDDGSVAVGSGTAVAASGSPSATLTAIPVMIPASITTGTHQLLVRGEDASGWGGFQSVSFKVDRTGPTVTGITPASATVNGAAPLAFTGSATDVGGGSVTGVTWAVDGGTTAVAVLNPVAGAPTVAFSGTVAAADVAALADGVHYISAVGTDSLGNVGSAGPAGAPIGAAFTVDRTAPTVGAVAVTPSPNDGKTGVAYDATSIEVRAPVADPGGAIASGVASGEGFIGTAGATGTGFAMVTNISGGALSLVGTIPLSQLTSLPEGPTSIWVRAKDKAGNWSTAVAGTLVMNRGVLTASVIGLALNPATSTNAATVALTGTATAQAGTTLLSAEYFIDTDPGVNQGAVVTLTPGGTSSALSATIPIAGLRAGTHTIGVRVRTANAAWGPVVTASLTLNPLFADGFEGGPLGSVTAANATPWAGVTTGGVGVNVGQVGRSVASASTGGIGLSVSVTATGSRGYVSTPVVTPALGTYHAQFQFNPNTLNTNGRWVSVFQAMGGASNGTERFHVEYQRTGTGTPQVRLVVNSATPATGPAVNVNANAANTIRIDYKVAPSTPAPGGSAALTVNNVAQPALTGLNTNNRTVTQGRLGISIAPSSGSGAYGGVIYLDAFNSAFYAF